MYSLFRENYRWLKNVEDARLHLWKHKCGWDTLSSRHKPDHLTVNEPINPPVLLTYPVSSSRFGPPLLTTDNQVLPDKEKKASSYERNEEIQAIRRKYTPGEEKETFKKEKKIKTMKIKFCKQEQNSIKKERSS